MDNLTIAIHNSFEDAHAELWFVEPPGFTALPVDVLLPAPATPAADDLRSAVAPLLDSMHDEMLRQEFVARVASGQRMLAVLREIGTVHCSIGLHRDDVDSAGAGADHVLLSIFTISWRDTSIAPRGVTAARAVTATDGHTHIAVMELPCGPATFSERTLKAATTSELPQERLLQIHAHLPHPDCKRLAVLTISTTATARRGEYRAILRQIAETVRFENRPGSAASIRNGVVQ